MNAASCRKPLGKLPRKREFNFPTSAERQSSGFDDFRAEDECDFNQIRIKAPHLNVTSNDG